MSISEINVHRIIAAVKNQPALYDRDDPRYHAHKHHKDKIWRAVCKEVCRDWGQLTSTQKVEFEHLLQKRWKNLRTCFTRELTLQRRERKKKLNEENKNEENENEENNVPLYSRRRKRYEHFDAMKFLLNPSEVDDMDLIEDSNEVIEAVYDPKEGRDDPLHSDMTNDTSSATSPKRFKVEEDDNHACDGMQENFHTIEIEGTQYGEKSSDMTREERLLELLIAKKEEETDEDRLFLLSLVSNLKKLKRHQKLQAKIEILNVFQRLQDKDESW